jgi:RNA polymerase sigma-70 factor (ECF subfamily)
VSDPERLDLEGLYRHHRAGLIRLVERELHDRQDAEDVVQIAFIDAQRALRRGTVPRNPRAWLAAIALNAARRLRRRKMNVEALEEYAAQEASRLPEIKAALAHLSKTEQAAVLYRDLLGLSYAETAEQMGTTVPAVTMLLHRARLRLRRVLAGILVGLGLSRCLRDGAWQATAAKAAGVAVLAGGLGTAGVVTARHAAHALAPGHPATSSAVAAPQGPHEFARIAKTFVPRTRAIPSRTNSSAGHAETGRTHASQAGAAGTQAARTEAQDSNVALPSPVATATTQTQAPPGSLSVSTQTQGSLTVSATTPSPVASMPVPSVTLPPLQTTTPASTLEVTVPTTVSVQTPVATVTVSLP